MRLELPCLEAIASALSGCDVPLVPQEFLQRSHQDYRLNTLLQQEVDQAEWQSEFPRIPWDEGRFALLHLLYDCNRFVFAQCAVLFCRGFWFVGCLLVGPLSWVWWKCLFGEVGPARSHGLDRTAANFTGADQWSSLPCCPERPRAAKPAHMVRSVRIQRHCGDGTLCWVLNIFARCCDFLLTAWPVQHYCKQRWDDDTLTDLNSYAWPQVMNRMLLRIQLCKCHVGIIPSTHSRLCINSSSCS